MWGPRHRDMKGPSRSKYDAWFTTNLEVNNAWTIATHRDFKNFYLLHGNGYNSVIFCLIHLISFAYGHWQAVLGVGWGNLEWSPWFVVKFWGRSKKFKILRFGNLLPTRLCRAATTKPRQIECSNFFLLDHKGKAWIYRLVSGSYDVRLWRKRDSLVEEDDCAPLR